MLSTGRKYSGWNFNGFFIIIVLIYKL